MLLRSKAYVFVALMLMRTQAFIYNAFTFTQGLILGTYFRRVADSAYPVLLSAVCDRQSRRSAARALLRHEQGARRDDRGHVHRLRRAALRHRPLVRAAPAFHGDDRYPLLDGRSSSRRPARVRLISRPAKSSRSKHGPRRSRWCTRSGRSSAVHMHRRSSAGTHRDQVRSEHRLRLHDRRRDHARRAESPKRSSA